MFKWLAQGTVSGEIGVAIFNKKGKSEPKGNAIRISKDRMGKKKGGCC